MQIAEMQDVFKTFYLEKYSGRRLGFLNSLGTCVLRSTFAAVKKIGCNRINVTLDVFSARGAPMLSKQLPSLHAGQEGDFRVCFPGGRLDAVQ